MDTKHNIICEGEILIAGDSLAKGVTFDSERKRHILLPDAFVAQVTKLLKPAVENISRYGYLSSQVLQSLRERLGKKEKETPAIVVMEVGGNDCAYNWDEVALDPLSPHIPMTPLPLYEENLLEMVDTAKSAGSQPVLCNLPPIDAEKYFRFITRGEPEREKNILAFLGDVGHIYWWHERYSATVERVAQKTDTPLMLLRSAMLEEEDYRAFVCDDGMHLNPRGHARMAEALLGYIRSYAPGLLVG